MFVWGFFKHPFSNHLFCAVQKRMYKKQPHKNVTQKQTILEKKNEIYQMNDLMLLT